VDSNFENMCPTSNFFASCASPLVDSRTVSSSSVALKRSAVQEPLHQKKYKKKNEVVDVKQIDMTSVVKMGRVNMYGNITLRAWLGAHDVTIPSRAKKRRARHDGHKLRC